MVFSVLLTVYIDIYLLRCSRMADSQLNVGDCQLVDPCDPDPCRHNGLRCTPNKNVCLLQSAQCPQYICSRPSARQFEPSSPCKKNKKSPKVSNFMMCIHVGLMRYSS